jgi:hypothetical protein
MIKQLLLQLIIKFGRWLLKVVLGWLRRRRS